MFNLKVSKSRIEVLEVETITSGSKNAIDVKFCFSEDWKGLTKTAFFRSGKPSREVTASWLLNNENTCKIPAEVLTRPNLDLFVGVRGNASTREGGDVVIPTIWAKLGEIKEGANGGDESENITPEEYEKLLGYISNKQDILEGEEGQYVGFDKERHAVAKDFTDTVVSKGEFDEYKQSQEKVLDDKIDTSGGTVTGPLLFVDETSVSSNAPDEEKTEQDVETGESKSGVSYSSGGIYKSTEGPLNIRTVSNHIQFADGQNKSLLSHVQGDNTIPDSVPNFWQLNSSIDQVKQEIPKKVTDLEDASNFATTKFVEDEIEKASIGGGEGTQGPPGEDGFSPTVSTYPNETNDGTIVTITDKTGPHSFEVLNGEDGDPGAPGIDGTDGVTFTPSVSEDGTLSWTNDGGLPNPEPVNIKGPSGEGTTGASIPSGGIIIWSGSTVPDGWALCDGTNGTPDLRGRFVLGNSTSHATGSMGGSETVTLSIDQIPSHNHILYITGSGAGSNSKLGVSESTATNTKPYYLTNTGGNKSHNNMPPYYTLAYIMKL